MMTLSKGNILRVTGPLWAESTGHREMTRSFDVLFDLHLTNRNNRDAGDLRHHLAHYDVIVMLTIFPSDPVSDKALFIPMIA